MEQQYSIVSILELQAAESLVFGPLASDFDMLGHHGANDIALHADDLDVVHMRMNERLVDLTIPVISEDETAGILEEGNAAPIDQNAMQLFASVEAALLQTVHTVHHVKHGVWWKSPAGRRLDPHIAIGGSE